jgi:hypothetical protein
LLGIFSEYFGFSCQFSFHRLLHNKLPSEAGTIGPLLTGLLIGLGFKVVYSGHNFSNIVDKTYPTLPRAAPKLRQLVAVSPPRRPGFKPGSSHVGFCDGQKWRWGRFFPRTSVSLASLHSICFSKIIFTLTRGWHNRPGVAVPIASQTKKKNVSQTASVSTVMPLWLNGRKFETRRLKGAPSNCRNQRSR